MKLAFSSPEHERLYWEKIREFPGFVVCVPCSSKEQYDKLMSFVNNTYYNEFDEKTDVINYHAYKLARKYLAKKVPKY